MKRVFTSMDPLLAEQVRSVLENAGIECHLAHRDLRSLAGAIPFPECSPEVWAVEESQAAAAERLIGELTAPRLPGDRVGDATCVGRCWAVGSPRAGSVPGRPSFERNDPAHTRRKAARTLALRARSPRWRSS